MDGVLQSCSQMDAQYVIKLLISPPILTIHSMLLLWLVC